MVNFETFTPRDNMLYIAFIDYSEDCGLGHLFDDLVKSEDIVKYWYCPHPSVIADFPFGLGHHVHYMIEIKKYSPLGFLSGMGMYHPRLCYPVGWVHNVSYDHGQEAFDVFEG